MCEGGFQLVIPGRRSEAEANPESITIMKRIKHDWSEADALTAAEIHADRAPRPGTHAMRI
jgi:hypothetical protein